MIADPADSVASREIASASLRTFMRLPVAQRCQRDPDGCARLLAAGNLRGDGFQPARGEGGAASRPRAASRTCRRTGDLPHPELSEADRDRLGAYVAHFNARDFDAIRAMIADDVRLDLVNKTRMSGKAEVSRYFGNYSKVADWHLVPGLVEGRPGDPGIRSRRARNAAEIFHAAAMGGRQGRRDPRFPPRALHHRWRRISGLIGRSDQLP